MSIPCISVMHKMMYCVVFVSLFVNKNISAMYISDDAPTESINEFNTDDIARGIYSFRFKTPTTIERNENGYLDDEGNLVVYGFYSYTDPDGKLQYVSYLADKDGYRTFKKSDASVPYREFDPNTIATLLG